MITRTTARTHALPSGALAAVAAADLLLGRDQVLIGLAVVSPMVAATVLGRRATAGYGALAVLAAVLLGVFDEQYTQGMLAAQVVRIVGVAVGAVAAVAASGLRQRREGRAREAAASAAADRAVMELAETLQRSLLTAPPQLARVATAVRYRPATRGAHVGGDWYDAFAVPDGTTLLVIGDVAGHDAVAAAAMAQARGLLRGLAQSVVGSPAAVLSALDRALHDLGIGALVTITVATVDERSADGVHLRWSNAGHPPPVLIGADGRADLLERPVERLLGVEPCGARADHGLTLGVGDTLLLYTDGLIERRGASLDAGLAALLEQARRSAGRPLEQLCDDVLAGLPEHAEDDVALLAARVRG
ncbi:PP2C family protein-serine/threonine phosphatase [Trujillonella humicola]|uniref:PP2C family protein-serine/threonine phosphatase n=1 Tax=Trujillonella humicola TaxID=3383699 RepID=UPI0039061E1D